MKALEYSDWQDIPVLEEDQGELFEKPHLAEYSTFDSSRFASDAFLMSVIEIFSEQDLTSGVATATDIWGESPQARFERLKQQWEAESAHMSSPADMAMLQSYQMIIGMGYEVVPILLADLQKEPNHWFWALTAITGVNPVPEDDLGRIHRMAEAWIRWGREKNIIG